MGHYGTLDREAMVNSAHFGGCSSPESWHDPSCGTLATCRLLPNLTPSRRGGVFSFAEIGLLCDGEPSRRAGVQPVSGVALH